MQCYSRITHGYSHRFQPGSSDLPVSSSGLLPAAEEIRSGGGLGDTTVSLDHTDCDPSG